MASVAWDRERFKRLTIAANKTTGNKLHVTEDDWLFLRECIVQNMESRGLTPVPWADSDGDMLFRGKGLVIDSTEASDGDSV